MVYKVVYKDYYSGSELVTGVIKETEAKVIGIKSLLILGRKHDQSYQFPKLRSFSRMRVLH